MMRVRALLPTVALTVGLLAGNAAAAFTGQSDITRTQAVSVLVSLGVLNGKSDGTFEPDGPVTAREAAKMLLTAGYSAEKEGLTGTDWVVAVDDMAGEKGLFTDLNLDKAAEALSRDNAAQMAYNTLIDPTGELLGSEDRHRADRGGRAGRDHAHRPFRYGVQRREAGSSGAQEMRRAGPGGEKSAWPSAGQKRRFWAFSACANGQKAPGCEKRVLVFGSPLPRGERQKADGKNLFLHKIFTLKMPPDVV